MKKFIAAAGMVALLLGASSCSALKDIAQAAGEAWESSQNGSGGVSEADIVLGLKEALQVGIGNGADLVSVTDGYFKRPEIKIPFPPEVKNVETALRDIGLGSEVDKAILTLNRAAEDAAKSAKPIFVSAIKQMTITDAVNILKGTDKTAATAFLKRTTGTQLGNAFRPVIDKSLDKTLATKNWEKIIGEYNKLPLIKKVNPDLGEFVTQKALDGLFLMVEKEELKIRKDPLARVSDLLKRVFKLQDAGADKAQPSDGKGGTTKPTTKPATKPTVKPKVKTGGG